MLLLSLYGDCFGKKCLLNESHRHHMVTKNPPVPLDNISTLTNNSKLVYLGDLRISVELLTRHETG